MGHLAERTAPCPVEGGTQELVDSTRALRRTLPPLRLVEQERMGLLRDHLRKGHVLHFQPRLLRAR
jgi:hypothetical protein